LNIFLLHASSFVTASSKLSLIKLEMKEVKMKGKEMDDPEG
jgi:hypothetical protein